MNGIVNDIRVSVIRRSVDGVRSGTAWPQATRTIDIQHLVSEMTDTDPTHRVRFCLEAAKLGVTGLQLNIYRCGAASAPALGLRPAEMAVAAPAPKRLPVYLRSTR
ncbi:MAG: hypothetical protein QM662_10880 [Gordonia sp. (in: high G+C Gram-positive bacteria)]